MLCPETPQPCILIHPRIHAVFLVSEGALDDFDKAKPSPAPPPTATASDASGSQKRSPGDTAKVYVPPT